MQFCFFRPNANNVVSDTILVQITGAMPFKLDFYRKNLIAAQLILTAPKKDK